MRVGSILLCMGFWDDFTQICMWELSMLFPLVWVHKRVYFKKKYLEIWTWKWYHHIIYIYSSRYCYHYYYIGHYHHQKVKDSIIFPLTLLSVTFITTTDTYGCNHYCHPLCQWHHHYHVTTVMHHYQHCQSVTHHYYH